MSRPRFELTEKHLKQIEKLASVGLGLEEIGYIIGTSHDTLTRRKKDSEEVLRAIKRGQAESNEKVARAVFNKALDGDVTACIWWEKTRAGRSERVITQYEGKGVEINIGRASPANAQSQAEYKPSRRSTRGTRRLKAV